MTGPRRTNNPPDDKWLRNFFQHLATDRGASTYTQRNYRQSLLEFHAWHQEDRHAPPEWDKLQRDDFRGYLRFLGRGKLGRAAIQLRFSALRTFYRFLIRQGVLAASPIKNLSLPQRGRRLPRFLTAKQMEDLLGAPLKMLAPISAVGQERPKTSVLCRRDVAVLETI